MSKTIEDYVKLYENVLDVKICEDIINRINEEEWEKHHYYNSATEKHMSYDDDLSVILGQNIAFESLNQVVWNSIYDYITNHLNLEYFNSWAGFSFPRFNKYTQDTRMRMHCDHIHSLFEGPRKGVPILTVLGALNDDYTGGEFFLIDKEVHLPKGSIVIFPSNFLYPHEVRHVKSGIRYTYVSWVW